MAPLVLQVSMGGGDRLPSGDPSARLPSYFIKKKYIFCTIYLYRNLLIFIFKPLYTIIEFDKLQLKQ